MSRLHPPLLIALALLTACGDPVPAFTSPDGDPSAPDAATPDTGLDDADLDDDALDASPDADPGVDLDADDLADALDPDSPDADPDLIDADTPDADPAVGTPCAVDGRPGLCLDTSDCLAPLRPTPGLCPGPASVQCCAPPPEGGACDPDAMPAPLTLPAEEPGDPGCPPGMASVEDFCVDRFEATLVEIIPNASPRPWSPFFNPGDRRVRALSLRGAIPQGYISQTQAGRACAEAQKRLCSDDEWLRACQGPQGFTYPYGDSRQPGDCNDARSAHPAVELFGNDNPFGQLSHPCINQLPDSLAPAGDHPLCLSPDGAFDMMGNLHEWTSNPSGVFRGGFYVDTVRNGPGCLYLTTAHAPSYSDYSTGFRCCADPE